MNNTLTIDKLKEYEIALTKFTEAKQMGGNDFEKSYGLFCEIYNYFLKYIPQIIKPKEFFSIHIITKKIAGNSNKYFFKHPEKLQHNLKVLLNIVQINISFNISEILKDFYIEELSLSNFKIFKSEQFTFGKGINLIVGNNGTGKTTVLDAISFILSKYLRSMDVNVPKNERLIGSTKQDYTLHSKFKYNKIYFPQSVDNLNEAHSHNNFNSLELLSKLISLQLELENTSQVIPIISYYCISKIQNASEYKSDGNERLKGYNGCLVGKSNIEEVKKWLRSADEGYKKHFIDKINDFIKELDDENTINIHWSDKNKDIVCSNYDYELFINQLSSGHAQILNMMIDLLYRARILNPFLNTPEEVTGIVLIDEIDLHLHPKWQWNIIGSLRNIFPNIQFIITTHSPFILSSSEEYRLIGLTDKVIYFDSAYGESIANISRHILGTYDIPDRLRELSFQFEKEWNDKNYEIAQKTVEKIREQFGKDNEIYSRLNRKLKFKFN